MIRVRIMELLGCAALAAFGAALFCCARAMVLSLPSGPHVYAGWPVYWLAGYAALATIWFGTDLSEKKQ